MPCIMYEMPYCPSCKFGHIVYPADAETTYDTYGGECEWVCTYKDEDVKEDSE